jgi:hypothetical protein
LGILQNGVEFEFAEGLSCDGREIWREIYRRGRNDRTGSRGRFEWREQRTVWDGDRCASKGVLLYRTHLGLPRVLGLRVDDWTRGGASGGRGGSARALERGRGVEGEARPFRPMGTCIVRCVERRVWDVGGGLGRGLVEDGGGVLCGDVAVLLDGGGLRRLALARDGWGVLHGRGEKESEKGGAVGYKYPWWLASCALLFAFHPSPPLSHPSRIRREDPTL